MVCETVQCPVTRTRCVPTCETKTCTVNVCKSVPYQATRCVTVCEPVCETVTVCKLVPTVVEKQVAVAAPACGDPCGAGAGCGTGCGDPCAAPACDPCARPRLGDRLRAAFAGFGGKFRGLFNRGGCGCEAAPACDSGCAAPAPSCGGCH
jgi:hypothetical protein